MVDGVRMSVSPHEVSGSGNIGNIAQGAEHVWNTRSSKPFHSLSGMLGGTLNMF